MIVKMMWVVAWSVWEPSRIWRLTWRGFWNRMVVLRKQPQLARSWGWSWIWTFWWVCFSVWAFDVGRVLFFEEFDVLAVLWFAVLLVVVLYCDLELNRNVQGRISHLLIDLYCSVITYPLLLTLNHCAYSITQTISVPVTLAPRIGPTNTNTRWSTKRPTHLSDWPFPMPITKMERSLKL